jgi:hypothetical protein
MANPNVRLKRSAVAGKRPEISQLELGEVALNTNDGRLFTRKYNVGIGSTVTLLNPWTENIGGSIYYNDGNVGIGTTNPVVLNLKLDIVGGGTKVGTATTYLLIGNDSGRNIEIGTGSTTLDTYIDFQGSATYTDYASRIIRSAGDNSNFNIINRGSGVLALVAQDTGVIDFYTQNTFRNRIDSNGVFLVGTGTSTGTANQRLQVSGGAYVSGAFGIGTTNPGYTLDVLTGGGARVGTANTFTIISPSFVEIGVGSSTLATLIDFHGADDVYPDYAGRLTRTSGANSAFSLVNRGTGALQIYAQDAGTIDFLTNSATPRGRVDALGNFLIGSTSATGTASQPLQVTGSAYVSTALGIGRTDPVANGVALDVSGNANITNYGGTTVIELGKGQTGNQFAIIDFVGDTTYTDYALRIIRDNTGANADSNIYHRGTGALRLYTVDSAPIDFRVSNSSYVSRYTSDGNFLINTITPTGTASQPLQVSGGAYFNGFVGIGTTNPLARLSIGAGSISDVNVPVQINAPTGGLSYYGANNNGSYGLLLGYDKVGFSGGVVRVVGATDSLDFVVNNTTRAVTITPSGNVGVGTTNPTSKIHIIGNSLVSGISSAIGGFNIGISSNGTLINSGPLTNINFVGVANTYSVSGTTVNITNAAYKTILIKRRFGIAAITTYGSYTIKSRTTTYTFNTSGTGVVVKLRTGISTAPYSTNSGTTVLYSENVVGGIASVTSLSVSGTSSVTDTRLNSVSEKSTLVSGNTVNLVYNTGSGNVAICTNPTGPITLNVTGIPTDSSFDNRVLTFSVIVIQGATGYACTTVNLNGVPETVRYPGGVISVGSTGSYDIFNFTGINTVGSASTAANYQVLGLVNGNFR